MELKFEGQLHTICMYPGFLPVLHPIMDFKIKLIFRGAREQPRHSGFATAVSTGLQEKETRTEGTEGNNRWSLQAFHWLQRGKKVQGVSTMGIIIISDDLAKAVELPRQATGSLTHGSFSCLFVALICREILAFREDHSFFVPVEMWTVRNPLAFEGMYNLGVFPFTDILCSSRHWSDYFQDEIYPGATGDFTFGSFSSP